MARQLHRLSKPFLPFCKSLPVIWLVKTSVKSASKSRPHQANNRPNDRRISLSFNNTLSEIWDSKCCISLCLNRLPFQIKHLNNIHRLADYKILSFKALDIKLWERLGNVQHTRVYSLE